MAVVVVVVVVYIYICTLSGARPPVETVQYGSFSVVERIRFLQQDESEWGCGTDILPTKRNVRQTGSRKVKKKKKRRRRKPNPSSSLLLLLLVGARSPNGFTGPFSLFLFFFSLPTLVFFSLRVLPEWRGEISAPSDSTHHRIALLLHALTTDWENHFNYERKDRKI